MFENWGKSQREIELENLIKHYEDLGDTTSLNVANELKIKLKTAKKESVQNLFAQSEGPGMDAVSLSGLGRSGIGYTPQRDITKTFPGSLSEREEEERLALRARVGPAPGLFKWA
tara:strand:+ start:94 stop:438 length:345 start_codon:yes stop_codon:yes gene_type:complete